MSKGRIIVVEDELIVARDIQMTLEGFGFEVPEIVSSGEEAVQAAYRLAPDLIMMDIMIKGSMDGVDAAEIIRSQFNIPVIYLTAYSDEETLRRAKLTESYGFISKPFDEKELFVAVEFALYKHQLTSKLMETMGWLEATVRSLPLAVVVCDREDRIRLINNVAEGLLGCRELDVKEKPLEEVLGGVPRGDDTGGDLVVQVLDRSGGSRKSLVCSQTPLRNEKGISLGKVLALRLT